MAKHYIYKIYKDDRTLLWEHISTKFVSENNKNLFSHRPGDRKFKMNITGHNQELARL